MLILFLPEPAGMVGAPHTGQSDCMEPIPHSVHLHRAISTLMVPFLAD